MKKTILNLTALLLIFAGSFSACKEKIDNGITNLEGSSWKLVGIVNTQTGALMELEPKGCDRCYTLTFEADNTYSVSSSTNDLFGEYIADYSTYGFQITLIDGTRVREIENGALYVTPFRDKSIKSFSLQKDELRLYYEDNGVEHYMLYEKKEISHPLSLVNTKWKLKGMLDVETNILTELEPKDCARCYTFEFILDGSFYGQGENSYFQHGMNSRYIVNYALSTVQFGDISTRYADTETANGKIFLDNIYNFMESGQFELRENELRLYYNNKKNCLLFNTLHLQSTNEYSAGKIDIKENEYVTLQMLPEQVSTNTSHKIKTENNTKGNLVYDYSFFFEYFNENYWEIIKIDGIMSDMALRTLQVGGTLEEDRNLYALTKLYNKGKKGKYRYVKSFSQIYDFPFGIIENPFYLCVEFEIK